MLSGNQHSRVTNHLSGDSSWRTVIYCYGVLGAQGGQSMCVKEMKTLILRIIEFN